MRPMPTSSRCMRMASPGEIWVLRADATAPQKITNVFAYLPHRFRLPRQERVDWKGANGATVEGLLMYPLDYETGHRYPLVVQTHGGPQASDKFGLGGSQNYVPVLAGRGYAVLQPNYRGSTGYGDAFTRDMVGHYFKNAHLDVLAGVDYLIKTGIADSTHLIKNGLERRRPYDEQDHYQYYPLQSGIVRRGRGRLGVNVRAKQCA